jgi:mono/diheme cytochrome c family protein
MKNHIAATAFYFNLFPLTFNLPTSTPLGAAPLTFLLRSRQRLFTSTPLGAPPLTFLLFTLTFLLPACSPTPYRQGESLYVTHCASCHIDDGLGLRGVIPPLAGADYVARDPAAIACIIRNGLEGEIVVNGTTYNEPMEGLPQLSDFQIANIINYINTAWGNDFGFVTLPEVRRRLEDCTE